MKPTTKLMIGAVVLSLAASAGLTAFTYAAETEGRSERPQLTEEQRAEREANHEAVQQALEGGDFTTWSALLADHPKAEEFATEENFNTLREAYALREAGDEDGARALLDEAGIHRPERFKRRADRRHRGERRDQRKDFRDAVANGDYATWAELNADHLHAEEFVNEETFSVLQQAYELAEAGDKEGAKMLLDEAGIKRPGRHQGQR